MAGTVDPKLVPLRYGSYRRCRWREAPCDGRGVDVVVDGADGPAFSSGSLTNGVAMTTPSARMGTGRLGPVNPQLEPSAQRGAHCCRSGSWAVVHRDGGDGSREPSPTQQPASSGPVQRGHDGSHGPPSLVARSSRRPPIDVDGEAARAGGGVDEDQRVTGAVGRRTGTATPVEVSLCAQAMTSTLGSDCGAGALPASALMTIGSPTNGFAATAEANCAEFRRR